MATNLHRVALLGLAASSTIASLVPGAARAEVDERGAFVDRIDIPVPPFHGIEPQLALVYQSQGGAGIAGAGWQLQAASAIRRTGKYGGAPSFTSEDRYVLDGAELLPCSETPASPSCMTGGTHATAIDDFRRIKLFGSYWYVWDRDGTLRTYSLYARSGGAMDRWLQTTVTDTHQNRVYYGYQCIAAEDECYLSSIEYGAGKSCGLPEDPPDVGVGALLPGVAVGFIYEPRGDALTYATGNGLATIGQRLRRIEVRFENQQTRAYTLSYAGSRQGGSSLAASVSIEGSVDPALAPADAPTQTFGMASTTAWTPWVKGTALDLGTSEWPSNDPDWQTFDTPTSIYNWREVNWGHDNPWFPADVNADGRTDALGVFAALDDTVELRAAIALPGGGFAVTAQATSWDYSHGWDTPRWLRFHVGDLDGDKRTDLTIIRNSGQNGFNVTTHAALSKGDGSFTILQDRTQSVLGWDFQNPDGRARSRWLGGDVDGDGRNDMVVVQPSSTCTAEVAVWCGCDPAANPSHSCSHAMFSAGISKGDGTYDWTNTHVPWTFRAQDDPHWHVGDHDGDGRADILRVEEVGPDGMFAYMHAHFGVALSTGTGAFTPVSTPTSPRGGTQDTTISYFSPAVRLASGRHDYLGSDRTLAGDFNGDGRTDLAMMNSYRPDYEGASSRIVITTALSQGELGRFEPRTYYSAISTRQLNSTHGARPERDFNRWFVSDVDGDGASDLVITSHADWADDARSGGAIAITRLVSDHRGGFTQQVSYVRDDWELRCIELDGYDVNCEGSTFHDLLPGDVNADGRDDLIYVGVDFDTLTAWLSVDPAQMPNVVNRSDAWRPTDVDGDGRTDFVAIQANNPGFMVSTRLQRDVGAFPTATLEVQETDYLFESELPGNAPQSTWHVMDIGGEDGRPDGKADLVLVEPRASGEQVIHAYLGNGDATWTRVVDPKTEVPLVAMTLPAGERGVWRRLDVDGNGAMDLVNISRATTGLRVVAVISNGDGTFAMKSREQFTATSPPTAVGESGPLSAEARAMLDPWEVVDLDGDGRDDLLHLEWRSTGTIARSLVATDFVDNTVAFNHKWRERELSIGVTPRDVRNYHPAELNGDGATDLVYVEALANPQRVAISGLLSKGDGSFAAAPAWTPHTLVTSGALDRRSPIVTDLDKDGRSDLVLATDVNGETRFLTMWNQVWRWESSQRTVAATTGGRSGRWMPLSLANEGSELVSISRGIIDVVRAVIPRDELVRHDNGSGSTTVVRYRGSEGSHANMPIGAAMRVVEQVEGTDVAHPNGWVQTVRLDGLRYSYVLHRPVGFHVARYGDARGTTIDVYEQTDFCGSRLAGTERHDASGKAISMTHVQYAPQGTGAAICLPRHVTRRECEGQPLSKCRITGETYDHDAYGNVIRLTEHGDLANPDDTRQTDHPTVPRTTPTDYIVDRPAYTNVSELVGGQWTPVASTLHVYDANADHTTAPTKGDLRESQAWDDVDQVYRTTRTVYTPSGLPRVAFGPPTTANPTGFRSEVTYDCAYKRFPVQQCNGVGCASAAWDRSLGVITSMTDLAGATITTAYDVLGREVRAENALGGVVTTTFPAAAQLGTSAQEVWTALNDGTADGLWSVRRFDGLGRLTRATDESGDVETFRYLDGTSAETESTTTFASGAPPAVRRVTYDAASRGQTQVVAEGTANQGNGRIDRFIGGWTEVDAMGNERSYFTDGYGRIVAVRDLFRPCEGWDVECAGGTYAFTRYVYDALDNLTDIVDDAGKVTHFERDSLGTVREQCDPDTGCTQLEYHPDGTIKAEVDADQRRVEIDYDAVGRPLRQVYSQAGAQPDRLVELVYDVDPRTSLPGPFTAGRLTRVIDKRVAGGGIIDTFAYDALGNVTREQRCVDHDCIETGFGYDVNGRLAEVIYPDLQTGEITGASERVDYAYDAAGRVARVGGYVTTIEYAEGKRSFVQYGNSVETVFTRDPDRGWLERVDVTATGGGVNLLTLEYGFDKGGRVRNHASTNLAPISWIFGYDALDRLTRVVSSNSAYDQTVEYHPTGQIKFNSAVGAYDYADPLHVHAVTSTTAGDVYGYDRSGRLLASKDVEVVWGTDGMPEQIKNAATGNAVDLRYDYRGERTKRTGSGGETTTFSAFVERMPNGHLATSYLLDGMRVARRELGQASYYTYDFLDGVRLVTDDAGAELARYDYAPFGATIASAGAIPNDLTLADGRSDEDLPLVDMNARFYDPRIGRFISADSVIPNVFDSQALDRFAYVLNSPTNFTDPTGHVPEPADDSHYDPDAKRRIEFDPEEITVKVKPVKVPGPGPAGITIGERDVGLLPGTSFDDVWRALDDTRNGMFWTGRLVSMLDSGKTSLTMPEFNLSNDDLIDSIKGDDLGGCATGCLGQGDGMPQSMDDAAAIRAEVDHYRQFGPRSLHDIVDESWGEWMGGWELLASAGGGGRGKGGVRSPRRLTPRHKFTKATKAKIARQVKLKTDGSFRCPSCKQIKTDLNIDHTDPWAGRSVDLKIMQRHMKLPKKEFKALSRSEYQQRVRGLCGSCNLKKSDRGNPYARGAYRWAK